MGPPTHTSAKYKEHFDGLWKFMSTSDKRTFLEVLLRYVHQTRAERNSVTEVISNWTTCFIQFKAIGICFTELRNTPSVERMHTNHNGIDIVLRTILKNELNRL